MPSRPGINCGSLSFGKGLRKGCLNPESTVADAEIRLRIMWRWVICRLCNCKGLRQKLIVRKMGDFNYLIRNTKANVWRNRFVICSELVELMLIVAAAFFILHAALAALLAVSCKKIFAWFLAHAIMHFHCHPRRDSHVHDRYNGKKKLFHAAKINFLKYRRIACKL